MIDPAMQTKHIIFISIDNLRYDCINCLSDKKALKEYRIENELKTPTLDYVAKKSICFTNIISTNTYTTASHASIITGLCPPRHGIRALYDTKLSTKVFTLAELLKNQGYLTILSTDVLELWKPLDLHRGFSYVFERQDKELCSFLKLHKADKIFAFVHFFDVHNPYIFSEYEIYEGYNSDYYDLLEKLDKKYKIGLMQLKEKPHTAWKMVSDKLMSKKNIFFPLYVKGVTKFDSGRFKNFIKELESSGYLRDSLFFIFSDHGEGKCLEGSDVFSHGGAPYEDVIKVPLLIYNNQLKPKIINTQASTVDIFPTILELSLNKDASVPYSIDGQSLLPLINCIDNKDHLTYSEAWSFDTGMYCGDVGKGIPHILDSKRANDSALQQRAVRTRNKKYIIYGKPEVFVEESIFQLPNEDFIKELYRSLLGRIEDKQGFEHYSKDLNQNILSKKDVLTSFLNSEEYKLKRKFIVFDLENDPEEQNPIDPLKNPLDAIEFFKYFDVILSLEKQAVRSEKVFGDDRSGKTLEETLSEATPGDKAKDAYTKEDEKKIKERLKSLGYMS